jgi:hypothetical protein
MFPAFPFAMYPAYRIVSYSLPLTILDEGKGCITNIVDYQIAVSH